MSEIPFIHKIRKQKQKILGIYPHSLRQMLELGNQIKYGSMHFVRTIKVHGDRYI